ALVAMVLAVMVLVVQGWLVRGALSAYSHASSVTTPGAARISRLIELPHTFNRPAFPSRSRLVFVMTTSAATAGACIALVLAGVKVLHRFDPGWLARAVVAVMIGILLTALSVTLFSRNIAAVYEHWSFLGDFL